MDLDSPKCTSIQNYGLHQMALPVRNHGLKDLKYGLCPKTMDFTSWRFQYLGMDFGA